MSALTRRRSSTTSDAAEYRMELAERTATKGGLKMGEDALAQAQAMIGPASQMFQTAQAQFQAEEAKAQPDTERGGSAHRGGV